MSNLGKVSKICEPFLEYQGLPGPLGGPYSSPPCPIQWVLLSHCGFKGSEDLSWHQAPGPACSSHGRSASTAHCDPDGQDLPRAPTLCWGCGHEPLMPSETDERCEEEPGPVVEVVRGMSQ